MPYSVKLKFHGSSFPRDILAIMSATSRACRARGLLRTTPTHEQSLFVCSRRLTVNVQLHSRGGVNTLLELIRHLDRFIRFAGLTAVTNRQTDRPTDRPTALLGTVTVMPHLWLHTGAAMRKLFQPVVDHAITSAMCQSYGTYDRRINHAYCSSVSASYFACNHDLIQPPWYRASRFAGTGSLSTWDLN